MSGFMTEKKKIRRFFCFESVTLQNFQNVRDRNIFVREFALFFSFVKNDPKIQILSWGNPAVRTMLTLKVLPIS